MHHSTNTPQNEPRIRQEFVFCCSCVGRGGSIISIRSLPFVIAANGRIAQMAEQMPQSGAANELNELIRASMRSCAASRTRGYRTFVRVRRSCQPIW